MKHAQLPLARAVVDFVVTTIGVVMRLLPARSTLRSRRAEP
jgi:hypothetical protein